MPRKDGGIVNLAADESLECDIDNGGLRLPVDGSIVIFTAILPCFNTSVTAMIINS